MELNNENNNCYNDNVAGGRGKVAGVGAVSAVRPSQHRHRHLPEKLHQLSREATLQELGIVPRLPRGRAVHRHLKGGNGGDIFSGMYDTQYVCVYCHPACTWYDISWPIQYAKCVFRSISLLDPVGASDLLVLVSPESIRKYTPASLQRKRWHIVGHLGKHRRPVHRVKSLRALGHDQPVARLV